jgi:ferritin-like metal-binding protein YciE
MKTVDDLFLHFLQDIYFAERQILKALPEMAKAAASEDLKDALVAHREETEGQVDRLKEVFRLIGKPAHAKTCEAIQGLLEEGKEILEEFPEGPVRDAGIIACAQAVEHYEMARYGALIAWAGTSGKDDVVALLEETLAEEKKADETLTELAENDVNEQAAAPAA